MNTPESPNTPGPTADTLAATRQLAGLAMQGMIVHQGLPETDSAREEYALWAYRMAQAMLATERRLHIG